MSLSLESNSPAISSPSLMITSLLSTVSSDPMISSVEYSNVLIPETSSVVDSLYVINGASPVEPSSGVNT